MIQVVCSEEHTRKGEDWVPQIPEQYLGVPRYLVGPHQAGWDLGQGSGTEVAVEERSKWRQKLEERNRDSTVGVHMGSPALQKETNSWPYLLVAEVPRASEAWVRTGRAVQC